MGLKQFLFKSKVAKTRTEAEQAQIPLEVLLEAAACTGNEELIQWALEHAHGFPWNEIWDGDTLLIIAVQANQVGVVKQLLESGKVDGDLPNVHGYTPLCLALKHGVEMVSTMIASGKVDINKPEASGVSPFAAVCRDDDAAMLDLFMSNPEVQFDYELDSLAGSPLMFAAEYGKLELVKRLAASGRVDVDRSELYGERAIHFAANSGHGDIVEYLLSEAGATFTQEDVDNLEGAIIQQVGREKWTSELQKSGEEEVEDELAKDVGEADVAAEALRRYTAVRDIVAQCRRSSELLDHLT